MAARIQLGSDDGGQTANWKRPVAADLTPGANNTVLRTTTPGPTANWGRVTNTMIEGSGLDTVLTSKGTLSVSWAKVAPENLAPGPVSTILNTTTLGVVQWTSFPIAYGSQLGAPYRVGVTDTGTTADVHYGRAGNIVSLRFAEATITVPSPGSIQLQLTAGSGGNYQSIQPVFAQVNGVEQTIVFQQDSGGSAVRYFKDAPAVPFDAGDVVTIRNHVFNSHAATA